MSNIFDMPQYKRATEQTMILSDKMEEIFKAATQLTIANQTLEILNVPSETEEDEKERKRAVTELKELEKTSFTEFKRLLIEMEVAAMMPRAINRKLEGGKEVVDMVVSVSCILVFLANDIISSEYGSMQILEAQKFIASETSESETFIRDFAGFIYMYISKASTYTNEHPVSEKRENEPPILFVENQVNAHVEAGIKSKEGRSINALYHSTTLFMNYCYQNHKNPGIIMLMDDICGITVQQDYSDKDIFSEVNTSKKNDEVI